MKKTDTHVQILAPVGSFPSLVAAIEAKADAVYFGVEHLNMRNGCSQSFSTDDLQEIITLCSQHGIKSYVTLNTIIYDEEIPLMHKLCEKIKDANASGIIATDPAVIQKARELDIPLTISTQSNISNIEAVRHFSCVADVMVLARELNLQQIESICKKIADENIRGPSGNLVQIEVFAHGALCMAISGKCYMSLGQYNHSANRGECLQACRRKYLVQEVETGKELLIDHQYIMSPQDLSTIGIVDKLIASGVSLLKIEGRGRSPEYVATVVKAYKEAVDAVYNNSYTEEKISHWRNELKKVYNRGFWEGGYYLGDPLEGMSKCHGSKALEKKLFVGLVSNYFQKNKIIECEQQSRQLKENDEILIIGKSTGVKRGKIVTLENHPSTKSNYGIVTFPFEEKVRKNDEIYLIEKREES